MKLIYRDDQGQELIVVEPWGPHSGNIPPPVIVYFTEGREHPFAYSGTKP